MTPHPALAQIDAALSKPSAPISREAYLLGTIAHHRESIRIVVAKAKRQRKFRAGLKEHNPSALQFYGEHLDLLADHIRRNRDSIRKAGGELRGLGLAQRKAA